MKKHLSVKGFCFVVLGLSLGSLGCGSHGSSPSVLTAPDEDFQSPFLRVRWFPVDGAETYHLRVAAENGAIILNEAIEPAGCTHAKAEGYTSGLCFYDFKRPDLQAGLEIELDAQTNTGNTAAALLRYRD
jgi:hypothetical protein